MAILIFQSLKRETEFISQSKLKMMSQHNFSLHFPQISTFDGEEVGEGYKKFLFKPGSLKDED